MPPVPDRPVTDVPDAVPSASLVVLALVVQAS